MFYRDKNPRIGDIFVTKGPFLKLYTSYIREFENMTTGLDDARRKYPEFEKVCSDFEVIGYLNSEQLKREKKFSIILPLFTSRFGLLM